MKRTWKLCVRPWRSARQRRQNPSPLKSLAKRLMRQSRESNTSRACIWCSDCVAACSRSRSLMFVKLKHFWFIMVRFQSKSHKLRSLFKCSIILFFCVLYNLNNNLNELSISLWWYTYIEAGVKHPWKPWNTSKPHCTEPTATFKNTWALNSCSV